MSIIILIVLGLLVLCMLPMAVELFMGLLGILIALTIAAAMFAVPVLILLWVLQ